MLLWPLHLPRAMAEWLTSLVPLFPFSQYIRLGIRHALPLSLPLLYCCVSLCFRSLAAFLDCFVASLLFLTKSCSRAIQSYQALKKKPSLSSGMSLNSRQQNLEKKSLSRDLWLGFWFCYFSRKLELTVQSCFSLCVLVLKRLKIDAYIFSLVIFLLAGESRTLRPVVFFSFFSSVSFKPGQLPSHVVVFFSLLLSFRLHLFSLISLFVCVETVE